MTVKPTISVIIPHYRDLGGLRLCLEALARQTYPAAAFDIIVADNNSPEGATAVSAVIDGRARLVVVEEKGAGPARNGAVAVATGDVLAFIDSDCVAEQDWLSAGVVGLEAYDFVGGRVRVLLENPPLMTPAEAFERVFAFDFKTYIERKGFTGSGNLFCSRRLFEDVGGFKTGVSEDVEWSRRAVAAGYRLGYAPLAVVGHPARRSWDELWLKWRRVNAETFGLMRSQPLGRVKWLLRSTGLLPSALIHTPKVLFSEELNAPGQRLAALGVLYRLRAWRLWDALRLLVGG